MHRPLFGHPMIAALTAADFPVALFDWSFGQIRTRTRADASDLVIAPCAPDEAVASRLKRWFSRL
jgi:hypothetical protein